MHMEIRGAEKLSFRERQVVTLKEMGYPTERIARQLQLSPATVGTLYSRARVKGYQVVMVVPGMEMGLMDSAGDEEEGE